MKQFRIWISIGLLIANIVTAQDKVESSERINAQVGALRKQITEATQAAGHETVIRHYEELLKLTDLTRHEWKTFESVLESCQQWPEAAAACAQAIESMDAYLETPIEELIRRPPDRHCQRTMENPSTGQAFIDGNWVDVRGGLDGAKRLVTRARDRAEEQRTQWLLRLGRLQRDKLNEISAAATTFCRLLGAQEPALTNTLPKIAEQRAIELHGKQPWFSPWIPGHPQSTALRELIATRKRMPVGNAEFWARVLLISHDPIVPKMECAAELARVLQTLPPDAISSIPPPLILIAPEKPAKTIKIHESTHSLQPFYWFINPHMDVRHYALTPPPGMEFVEATVWAERNAKVNCRVTALGRVPWKEWDFEKSVYTRYTEQNREMAKRQLRFCRGSGLLLIEVNNSREAEEFSVRASFRKREVKKRNAR